MTADALRARVRELETECEAMRTFALTPSEYREWSAWKTLRDANRNTKAVWPPDRREDE
jgi:hypothetical protein